jgi:antirestriction protein ArdC
MTNAQIVFNAQIELVKAGKIGTTGNMMSVELQDGTTQEMPEPEAIHTYKAWQRLGYQVKHGEKAVCDLHIWKYTTKKLPEAVLGEDEESKMFFTKAYFFSASQVEKIGRKVDPSEFVGKPMCIEIGKKKRK